MTSNKGQVIKGIGDLFLVLLNNEIHSLKARGNLKKQKIIVGDYVEIKKTNEEYIIERVLPRKNSLIRPKICNVDQMIIVMSTVEPEFSTLLLDKFLLIAEFNNITPIIYLSKQDLVENIDNIRIILKYYNEIGYKVIYQKESIKPLLKGKITVITGQTGVGKSTLLNSLYPDLEIKTNKISKALNRGKHTTRHTTMYQVDNYLIADTPGFSAFDLSEMTKEDVITNYSDFLNRGCKYNTCTHQSEPECKIKKMVDNNQIPEFRYNNYLKLLSEVKKWNSQDLSSLQKPLKKE